MGRLYVKAIKNGSVYKEYPNTKQGLEAAVRFSQNYDIGLELFVYDDFGRISVIKKKERKKELSTQEKINKKLDIMKQGKKGIFQHSAIKGRGLDKYTKKYLESSGYRKRIIEKRIGKLRIHQVFWVEPGFILTDALILKLIGKIP